MNDVTRILSDIEHGDPQAAEQLLPLVYDELRKLAAAQAGPGEAGPDAPGDGPGSRGVPPARRQWRAGTWDNRRHFFAAAAEAMRRILVEQARRKTTRSHGGGKQRVDLDEHALVVRAPPPMTCWRSMKPLTAWRPNPLRPKSSSFGSSPA